MNWNNKSFQPERLKSWMRLVKQSCCSLSKSNDANPPSGRFPGERQTCLKLELTGRISAIVYRRMSLKSKPDGDTFTG